MNCSPTLKTTAFALVLAGTTMFGTQALAHDTGYAHGSDGNVVRHATGCVHSATWSMAIAVAECEGTAPEPKAPAPAPMTDGDADGDGVMDSKDKCPGTAAHVTVDANGCPAKAAKLILGGVNFHFDSADLTSDSSTVLDRVGSSLKNHPNLMIEVAGHTDSAGPDSYNMGLSTRRANAVRDYLISQGVSGGNLSAVGYGESQPISDNSTSAGRAANRRVELQKR